MSSYNNIEKIKYSRGASEVVSLDEYIVFEDERAGKKYIVFRFENNVNQQLLGMEFEVKQYDGTGGLVEQSVVIYNKFLAKGNEAFVPKAKLKVNYACKTISVRLIKAAFDRFLWNEGEYLDNSYKFEHYVRDEEFIKSLNKTTKPAAAAYKAVAPAKPERVLSFRMKNATRKNIPVFPAVFNVILFILIVAFIGVSLWLFTKNSDKLSVGDFDLRIIDGNSASITGYAGEEDKVTVPQNLGGYTITKIDGGAFAGSSVREVSFECETLWIEDGAFKNCNSLEFVTSSDAAQNITVSENAFADCKRLNTVILPAAYVYAGAFTGCVNVQNFVYHSGGASSFAQFFGDAADYMVLAYVGHGMRAVPYGYFDGITVYYVEKI